MAPVVLASLPFGPLQSPSLGLSLLQAGLVLRGINTHIRYFTLDFARRIGAERYQRMTGHWFTPDLVGEWAFAEALQGKELDQEEYIQRVLKGGDPAHHKSRLLRPKDLSGLLADLAFTRKEVPAFIDACADSIVRTRPKLLGLTSVFEQTAASLALAKRLKAQAPEILIVFGGANAEGEMGQALFEAYTDLDAVVSGEAEHSFPEAVAVYLTTGKLPRFPGFAVREKVAGPLLEASPQADRGMDDLPVPDFRDYFEQLQGLDMGRPAELLFETSRGCWWGQKQHCTFCGLNGASMAFRSKSPDRAYEELKALVQKHPGHPVAVVDNILEMGYFKTLLPRLASEGPHLDLFWEVKANLTEEQLHTLKAAGVKSLQPGIESLSDEGLRLMRKGISALQNVLLLKRCGEVGIDPAWSLLVGFPGEDAESIQRMADLLPLIHHLKPPALAARIRLDRFSPNFTEATARGLANLRAFPSYGLVHGLPQTQIDRMAYYFAYDYADGRDVNTYLAPLETEVEAWQHQAGSAHLMAIEQGGDLLVLDSRGIATAPLHLVVGAEADLLRAGRSIIPLEKVQGGWDRATLQAAAHQLESKKLILRQGEKILGLPLFQELHRDARVS